MTFSQALEQFLDARERLHEIDNGPQFATAPHMRKVIVEDLREAADAMDKLAPGNA